MPTRKPVFTYENCIGCGICVADCPLSSLELNLRGIDSYKNGYPVLTERYCSGCAVCAKHCPMDAIRMQESA